jgi:HEAT repeat protein
VLVRGRLWKDTSEDRWGLAAEHEASGDSSVEGLVKRLARSQKVEVRRSAAEALGQLGPAAAPAIPALLKCAFDVDAAAREAALKALHAIDPAWPENAEARRAFPGLVAALRSWDSDVSTAAFRLLGVIGLPAVHEMVNALSKAEDTIDKVYIMRLLARIGPQAASALPSLTRALGSKSIQARVAAAEALANIGSSAEAAVPALVAALTDPYADGRKAMAACLARLGAAAEPAIPALLPLLADRDSGVREAAAFALEKIGPKSVPALIETVQTRDVRRLKAWIASMIKASQWLTSPRYESIAIDYAKAWSSLHWAAYDTMEERACLEAAQEAALQVLGKFGPASLAAVPTIRQALADPNPAIKTAAVQALGQIGPDARSAIPNLIPMLLHGSEPSRVAASLALLGIDPDWECDAGVAEVIAHAIPLLIHAVESSGDRVTQRGAVKALGLIGKRAKAAIPALTRALQDGDRWLQDEAARALAKIDDHPI